MKVGRKIIPMLTIWVLLFSIFVMLSKNFVPVVSSYDGAELTGTISDYGEDTDSDGLFDYLIISVEVNVSSSGNYQLEISCLKNPLNYSYYVHKSTWVYLGTGAQWASLSLYGPRMYKDKFNASSVGEIRLYGDYWNLLDVVSNVPLSRVYHYNEFDCRALFTGNIYSQGVDTDGDGLFNNLQVGVEINVVDTATYGVYVSTLYGSVWVYVSNSTSTLLYPGLNVVNVSLNGAKIYASRGNVSAIYSISLSTYDQGYSYTIDELYSRNLSRTYSHAEFDPLAYFTGVILDEGVDEDSNGLFDYLKISVQINVTDAGYYHIRLENLYDNSSNYMSEYLSYNIEFSIGLRYVDFYVYGPKIYGARLNATGIQFLSISCSEGGMWITLDNKYMVPLPVVYDYNQFESHAILTGKLYDHGVDTDSDRLFDYLEVGVEVNVTEAGKYGIQIGGLAEEAKDSVREVGFYMYSESELGVGVHIVNFSIAGAMIAYHRINPMNITYIYLIEHPYYNLGFLRTAALSQKYNYTQFNTPFNDMKIEFTVYPNATVLMSGSTNHTRIYPNYRQYQPLINASFGLSTSGDTTMGSLNGRLSIPEYGANEFPFNSTTMNFASTYRNGMLNDQLNATMLMPPAGSTTYPFNSSDFRLLGTYSERMFNVDLYGQTVFPPVITSQLPFNVSDLTVLAEYKNGLAKGNITFHTVSGFPLGDVILHFNGSRTELSLTGHANVIYGDYSGTTINETVLEDTLFTLNNTIPGRGEGSLYNMTQGIIECTNLNSIKTPLGGPLPGARVDYSATISGNSTELIAKLLTQMFFGGWASEETHSIVYAAFDAALSSVDYASLELNYFYGSRFGSIHIKLISDVKELWSNALVLVPPVVPPENRSQVEAWLKIANITAFAVKNVYLNVDYSSTEQRLSLHASRTVNSTELEDEMLPLLPDAVPPQLRDWVQSFTNTTFCRLDSYNATCNYTNGIASFDAKWILKGDFTAELNHVKRCYIELLNMTSPWVMNWHLEMLNASEVDLGNLKLELRQGGDWETISFQGIKVQTVKDDIDGLRFRLYRFFNMTSGSYESPRDFEKLKVTVNAGFNGTHTLLLYAQGAMPNPSATSLDYKSMTWENVMISSLKDLLFKIAYQGVINYAGQTFYVPIFTNSTVGNFGFDAGTKQISFGVAGTTGTGFCNITIPRALLYAAPSEWVITMNGTALTPGSFNVTENDGYVFIYLPYSHSTHLIQIQGTWIITEFPPNMFPLILTILSFIAVVVAVKERRRLNKMRMKYRSSLRTFVSKLYLTKP